MSRVVLLNALARGRAWLSPAAPWARSRAAWARSQAGLAALLLFIAIFLTPQFVDGYGGDDLLNSCTRGHVRIRGAGLAEYLNYQIQGWMSAGRFFPLAILQTYGMHYLHPSAAAFHALVFVVLLADVALFYCLLRQWRVAPALARLSTLFLALSFQLRFFFDPILQFAGMLPLLAAEILMAMIAFERFLASRRGLWQATSLVVYAMALLTYEIAFMVAPVFWLMARARGCGWRETFAAARAHATLLLVLVAFTLGLRNHAGWSPANPNAPRFDAAAIVKTTALQASAALPLSYALLSEHRADTVHAGRLLSAWRNWAIFAAAAALTWAALRQADRATPAPQKGGWRLPALAGGVLWVLPGAPIAALPKYQQSVRLGIGYLPVFLQYFGVALLALAFVLWARQKLPRLWPKLAWGIVAFNAAVAMITFDANRTVAARMNADHTQKAMALIASACESGLFDSVPPGATIASLQGHPWLGGGPEVAGGHFSTLLGRIVYGMIGYPTPQWFEYARAVGDAPPPAFVMNDLCPDADWSYVLLGSVESPAGGCREENYRVRRFRLFLSGSYARRAARPGQLAIAVLIKDDAGRITPRLSHWTDLAELDRARAAPRPAARQDDGRLVLEGLLPQSLDMALVCVVEVKEIAGRIRSKQSLTLR